ncbi:MAG TPA: hypothetical protein VGD17_02350 [Chitinophagaceae bacterium]
MSRAGLLFLFLLTFMFAHAQNNVLLLQKRGKTQQTFFPGRYISLQTKQGSYAQGMITRVGQDTIYIRYFDVQSSYTGYGGIFFDTVYRYTTALHHKDIGALIFLKNPTGRSRSGSLLMIAGGGVLMLGAVNGLYRSEPPREWYKPSSYITAGVLTGLGLLMKRSGSKKRIIGKKYAIKILPLDRR